MQELSGRVLGSYRLIEQTATGGMAIIFKAYDESLDRYVAVKILPAYLSVDPQFSARFRAEARNVARLRHPNILPVFNYGEENGLSYFVMDLVEGGTLKELLGNPLPVDQVTLLVSQIADALQYAHDQGIVHRDVKPSNVLMLRPDWALLSDFGIARVLEQTGQMTHTGSAFFGTPHYMAPEQARGDPVSARTDQYALGVVIYEMLTGAAPFRADTPQAVVYQHIYSQVPPLHERLQGIQPSVEAVVLRALAKDADERFESMKAMSTALRAATQGAAAELVADADPSDSPAETFSPAAATAAFRSVTAASMGSTERIERQSPSGPLTPEQPVATSAPLLRRGARIPLLAAAGACVLVVAIGLTAFLLHSSGGLSSTPVSVTLRASAAPSQFSLVSASGHTVRRVTIGTAGTTVKLPPGSYTLKPSSTARYLDPAAITVRNDGQTIDLAAIYGRLSLLPAAGRVLVPDLTIVSVSAPRRQHFVSGTQATAGGYLLAGRYRLQFDPGDYPSPLVVSVPAGSSRVLDLSRAFGRLIVIQLRGAPPSGFDIIPARGGRPLTGSSAEQGRQGNYVPVGSYLLHFYYSDSFPDPVAVTIKPGAAVTADLNRVFATIRVPPTSRGNTVTYSWQHGSNLDSLTSTSRWQSFYVLAGRFRIEITTASSTRVVAIAATAGGVTSLPHG